MYFFSVITDEQFFACRLLWKQLQVIQYLCSGIVGQKVRVAALSVTTELEASQDATILEFSTVHRQVDCITIIIIGTFVYLYNILTEYVELYCTRAAYYMWAMCAYVPCLLHVGCMCLSALRTTCGKQIAIAGIQIWMPLM